MGDIRDSVGPCLYSPWVWAWYLAEAVGPRSILHNPRFLGCACKWTVPKMTAPVLGHFLTVPPTLWSWSLQHFTGLDHSM